MEWTRRTGAEAVAEAEAKAKAERPVPPPRPSSPLPADENRKCPARVALPMRAALPLLLILLAAGCLGEPGTTPTPRGDTETSDAGLRPLTASFDGSATGSPAAPFLAEFAFDVPSGAVGVNGTLLWSDPVARFSFSLVDPRGEVVAEGYPDARGGLVVVTVEPPRPGAWTFRVESDLAVNAAFTVDAVAELLVPKENLVAKTVELGQASFYEVNLILEEGASFAFAFNSSAPVRWDIHSHPPEGLKTWDHGEGATGAASFQAPARAVYSVLWENPGALPVDLSFEVTGEFRVHSHGG